MVHTSLYEEAKTSPVTAVNKLLTEPAIYDVGNLMTLPAVQELATSNAQLFATLTVFANGTVDDVSEEIFASLPEETQKKIRQLSIASYGATESRILGYDDLMKRLRLSGVRQLEELVIDAIYAGVIKAKLDSRGRYVEVTEWMARHAHADVASLCQRLDAWTKATERSIDSSKLDAIREDQTESQAKARLQRLNDQISEARTQLEQALRNEHAAMRRPRAGKKYK